MCCSDTALQPCEPTSSPPQLQSQKGVLSEARGMSGVFVRQQALFSHSVVLACICTYPVTNRTIGFICDWQVFLTSIDTKPPYHYCPEHRYFNGTHQSAASQNPSNLSPDWYLDYSGGNWQTHVKASFLIHLDIMKRLNANGSSLEQRHKSQVLFCCKEDKRLFRGYKGWQIVEDTMVAQGKKMFSAVLPFHWLTFYSH